MEEGTMNRERKRTVAGIAVAVVAVGVLRVGGESFAALMMAAFAGCGLPGFANFAGEITVFFGAWQSFRLVTILGLGGIGKTRLLDEVTELAAQRGFALGLEAGHVLAAYSAALPPV